MKLNMLWEFVIYLLIVGSDFNVILNKEEKLRGCIFSINEVTNFEHCINNCSLTEVPLIGSRLTWWNERIESD